MIWIQLLFSFPLEIQEESQANWDKAKEGSCEEGQSHPLI